MAVTFNAVTSFRTPHTGGDSFTHTPVGVPSAVVVTVQNDPNHTMTTMTYGGVAMTFIQAVNSPNSNSRVEQWGLASPPSGAQTVAMTWTGTLDVIVGCITVLGSGTTFATAFGIKATNSSNSGNATLALGAMTAGSMAIAGVGNDHHITANAAAWSAASPGTERWNLVAADVVSDAAGQTSSAPGATTFTWTNNNSSEADWAIAAVEVLAQVANRPIDGAAWRGGWRGMTRGA